jgi:hypothetical protein
MRFWNLGISFALPPAAMASGAASNETRKTKLGIIFFMGGILLITGGDHDNG